MTILSHTEIIRSEYHQCSTQQVIFVIKLHSATTFLTIKYRKQNSCICLYIVFVQKALNIRRIESKHIEKHSYTTTEEAAVFQHCH